jgi:hypothetical protein
MLIMSMRQWQKLACSMTNNCTIKAFTMKKNLFKYISIMMIITLYNACTVYDNPAPFFEDAEQLESPAQRKILMISIDGLVGQELEKSIPTNMQRLIDKGKFTFNSLSDEKSTPAATWTTMMTGVSSAVHHVEDESFRAKANEDDQHEAIAFTPTFFYRLFSLRPEYNTVVASTWEPLVRNLLVEAESQVVATSDSEVKDSIVNQLKFADPEIVIANFRNVFAAGEESGFTIDNPQYSEAISEIDGYIGEILKALEEREDYDKEEWMVIVTSNQGGSADGSFGSDSFEDRNTFTILHYKNFTSQKINPSLIASSNFTQFEGSTTTYVPNVVEATDANQYNFTGDEMSVEFKMRKNRHINWTSQPFVIGKTARKNHAESGRGWGIGTENNRLRFYITFDDDVKYEYLFSADINDFKWHHFSFSLKKVSSKAVQLTLFTDGVTSHTATITTTGTVNGTMSSTAPLFVGVRTGHNGGALSKEDLNFADLRIYNKAIEARDASRISCYVNDFPTSDALSSNIIGSYKMDNVEQQSFLNDISDKPSLRFINANNISKTGKTLISTKCNEEDRMNILITNEDLTTMIFYWLRITPELSWGLKGNRIINTFEEEFVNIK